MNNFTSNRYIRDLRKNRLLILTITSIIVFWSVLFLLFFYTPNYKSEAKILIKDNSNKYFVTELGGDNTLTPLTSAGNPLLTQIEILKSKQLEDKVKSYIGKNISGRKSKSFKIESNLNVSLKTGTDILNVSFEWDNPCQAQAILKYILKEYDSINLAIVNKIKTQRRKYIDIQLKEINQKLIQVRQEIEIFKSENLVANIEAESQSAVNQKQNIEAEIRVLNASISKNKSLAKSLEKQLKLKPNQAIKAIALGSTNSILTRLYEELNTATQEYYFDLTKYADTNPKIVAQKNKINHIKAQIQKQIKVSLGNTYYSSNSVRIYDPVRQNMINNLVTAHSEYISDLAERTAQEKNLKKINDTISKLPAKQLKLVNLMQEELNLSNAYNELRSKQIEANIQEAETASNISVIDIPSLSFATSFPGRLNILLLSVLGGLILAIISSFLKTQIDDVCEDIDFIEYITKKPLIGIIPWVNEVEYDEDKIAFMSKIAYTNIVSALTARCVEMDKKVLTFTSTSIKKPHSTIVNKIAEEIIRVGQSVVVVDTDLRLPSSYLNEEDIEVEKSFYELITEVNGFLEKKMPIDESIISNALIEHNGCYKLLNKKYSFEPYDVFGTPGYSKIIDILSAKYDWVLIDTSAAHISSDFNLIAKQSNGVVIFINKTATYSVLTNLAKTLAMADIPILGSIFRRRNSKLEREYENYVRYQYEKYLAEESIESEIEEVEVET